MTTIEAILSEDGVLGGVLAAVRSLPAARDDAERIDRLRRLEELKSAIAAAQLAEAAAFASSQRTARARVGVPAARQDRGVSAQVALALRTSPHQAARWLGYATVLTTELPATFAALAAGRCSERRAVIMARETIWLSGEGRAEVDAVLGPRLDQLSDSRVEGDARRHAYRLDPAGVVERHRVAPRQRRVTVRPMPDTMTCLSAVTSVEQGVTAWATLRRDADSIIAVGDVDGRTRDQIMADLAIERLTGQARADAGPVAVELLIGVDTLLDARTRVTGHGAGVTAGNDLAGYLDGLDEGDDIDVAVTGGTDPTRWNGPVRYLHNTEVATRADAAPKTADEREPIEAPESIPSNPGRGHRCLDDDTHRDNPRDDPGAEPALVMAEGIRPTPIPAPLARQLITDASSATLRRLFTAPATGQLITMESRARIFPAGLRDYIRYRDQQCTTPYCGAPIRHIDHARPHHHGGPTAEANGNGTCAACNWAKQAPGWAHTATTGGRGTITTPTGHTYRLHPPRPPGRASRPNHTPLVDGA